MLMGGKTNRTKGHNFERDMRLLMRQFFPECETSRYANRRLDDLKVDLCNTDPFYFQCKNTATAPNMHKLLGEMPQDTHHNVVLHKRTRKGVTVTMMLEDFVELLKSMKSEGII